MTCPLIHGLMIAIAGASARLSIFVLARVDVHRVIEEERLWSIGIKLQEHLLVLISVLNLTQSCITRQVLRRLDVGWLDSRIKLFDMLHMIVVVHHELAVQLCLPANLCEGAWSICSDFVLLVFDCWVLLFVLVILGW
jgi:hypothetical protein